MGFRPPTGSISPDPPAQERRLPADGTTTTGHLAWSAHPTLTDPGPGCRILLAPLDPTTRRSALSLVATRARAAGGSQSVASTTTEGSSDLAVATAASRIRCSLLRTSGPKRSMTSCLNTSTWTISRTADRALASSTAQTSARIDSGEPSTPTTTRLARVASVPRSRAAASSTITPRGSPTSWDSPQALRSGLARRRMVTVNT